MGNAQARNYIVGLRQFCMALAETPGVGRPYAGSAEILRTEHSSHVVFYRQMDGGVSIVRILHKSMLPNWHLFEDD